MSLGRALAWGASLLAHGLAAVALLHVSVSAPPESPPLMDLVVPAPEPAEEAAAPRLDVAPPAPEPTPADAVDAPTEAAVPPEPETAPQPPPDAVTEVQPDATPTEEPPPPVPEPALALADPVEPPEEEPPPPPPTPVAARPPPPPPRVVRTPPRPRPTQAPVAATAAPAAPPSAPVAAPAPVAPPPTWLGSISAALARHHTYPARLRAQRAAGVVMVRFTLDRTGKLMSRRVERSSGNAELDSLALELLGRAAPLPPPPPEMPGAVVELVVPVRYTVR